MTAFNLEQYGVRLSDEGLHAFDPADTSWNESVFFDWVRDETLAGHIRIGRMPGEARVWVWIHVLHEGEWVVLEHPFIPIASVTDFDVALPGLTVKREVVAPLQTIRVVADATGRIVTGPRAGQLVSFGFDLVFSAAGPAHSIGESILDGHVSEISTSRYEQPMDIRGTQRVGEVSIAFEALGERDHSWGPRDWNIGWTFMPVSRPGLRALAIRVSVDEETHMDLGYLVRDEMAHVFELDFALTYDADVTRPFAGRARLVDEHDFAFEGRVEPITGSEIDLSHVLDGTRRSLYRRALVRFVPDDGSAPLYGFLEVHRFLEREAAST